MPARKQSGELMRAQDGSQFEFPTFSFNRFVAVIIIAILNCTVEFKFRIFPNIQQKISLFFTKSDYSHFGQDDVDYRMSLIISDNELAAGCR
jgi:hypothetical protein